MTDVKWIKIVTDIFDDEKILLIESMPDADSLIVIWFKLLCMAGKQNNSGVFSMSNGVPYTEKMLSTVFRRKESVVSLALRTFEQFGMIEIINNTITVPNWGKHQNFDKIEARNEYQRNYMRDYRERQKALTDGTETDKVNGKTNCKVNSKANVSSLDKNKIREEKKETYCANKELCTERVPTEKEYSELFELLWKSYPVKKGKGQVSATQKKKLYSIGKEELQRAIKRYQEDLLREEWRKPQNGSTFFNSGYIDYLDDNYTTEIKGIQRQQEELPEDIEEVLPEGVVVLPDGTRDYSNVVREWSV